MKIFYIGMALLITGVLGVWVEALWLLGGSNPRINTSIDTRAVIVIATSCVGLAGAVLALVAAIARRRYRT